MAIVSPGALISDVAAVGSFSGNEITDATRAAALAWLTTQQGGSTDGATPPAGVAVWRAGTNLFQHGQDDTSASFNVSAGATATLDPAVPAPFSPQSVRIDCDGTGQQRVRCVTPGGLALATGTSNVGSIYFSGISGRTYNVFLDITNVDTTTTLGAAIPIVASGSWQLAVPAAVLVAAAETGNILGISVQCAAARVDTFHVAHPMIESGQGYVSPYVATSQGANATRAASHITVTNPTLAATEGWFAARVILGWGSAQLPANATNTIMLYGTNSASQRFQIFYLQPSNAWIMRANDAGGHNADASIASAPSAGDTATIVGYWINGSTVAVSVNGSAFTTAAVAFPVSPAAVLQVGASDSGGTSAIDAQMMWAIGGEGTLTNADAAALNALPNVIPSAFTPAAASASVRWMTYAPVGPRFRKVMVGDPVVVVR